MQTLISAFKDRVSARRAMERLQQAGFSRSDIHLQGGQEVREAAPVAGTDPIDREIGERTMASAEREVAVDGDALEAVGNFFSRLFGGERGETHATRYARAVSDGHVVLVVDAKTNDEAETAAIILHDTGATDVDDHEEGRTSRAGVRMYQRAGQPTLSDLVDQRHLREESIMATRAGQVTRDSEERAIAAAKVSSDKDRPR